MSVLGSVYRTCQLFLPLWRETGRSSPVKKPTSQDGRESWPRQTRKDDLGSFLPLLYPRRRLQRSRPHTFFPAVRFQVGSFYLFVRELPLFESCSGPGLKTTFSLVRPDDLSTFPGLFFFCLSTFYITFSIWTGFSHTSPPSAPVPVASSLLLTASVTLSPIHPSSLLAVVGSWLYKLSVVILECVPFPGLFIYLPSWSVILPVVTIYICLFIFCWFYRPLFVVDCWLFIIYYSSMTGLLTTGWCLTQY